MDETTAPTNRAPAADPWQDLASGTLETARGPVSYVRPRSPMDLLVAQDVDDDEQAYPPYWAELWSSGVELALAVAAAPFGPVVLEIGCGLGLPSVAAALAGARVLATDRSPDAVAFAAHNARLSGAALETAVVSWTPGDALVERGPWDLVLAADVLYSDRNSRELVALLPRLLAGGGEIWVADPGRPQAAGFAAAARRGGFTVTARETREPGVTITRVARDG
ncbi:MAG: methyltransferase domain-containing protein [Actinomycetota bacterium]|nr:methyltransferase domain-containing protein [Actinomycetota bacterium]